MLNFLISTIAFSFAAYVLNHIFNSLELGSTRSRSLVVMVVATIISLGAGWAIDKLDGEAELHKNEPSIADIAKSGDPVKIAKMLTGFN